MPTQSSTLIYFYIVEIANCVLNTLMLGFLAAGLFFIIKLFTRYQLLEDAVMKGCNITREQIDGLEKKDEPGPG